MPFTPFHWGPSSWFGFLFYRRIHFLAFLVANVIIDIEPFLVLVFRWEYPLHGFFHSFLGGTVAAVLLAVMLNRLHPLLAKCMRLFRLEQTFNFKGLLLTCLLGVYFHIFLDSFLYTDIRPFYPFRWNPFYGEITSAWMYGFCIVSFVAGSVFYLIRKEKTWFGNFLAICIGLGAITVFALAIFLNQSRRTKTDDEMMALWNNHQSQFSEMAEGCNWLHDGPNLEPIYATESCLKTAKELGFRPRNIWDDGESVRIGSLYKGYVYSEKELRPLRENLDAVPIGDIPPYSAIYRKLNDNWYLYKQNPSD